MGRTIIRIQFAQLAAALKLPENVQIERAFIDPQEHGRISVVLEGEQLSRVMEGQQIPVGTLVYRDGEPFAEVGI